MNRSRFLQIVLLILIIWFYWTTLRANDPRANDFAAFYSGAMLWSEGHAPYDLKAECEIQKKLDVPLCLPFFHPPILLPLTSVFVDRDYKASYLRWAAVLTFISLLCLIPLWYLTGSVLNSILYLSFVPIFTAILQGQDTGLVLVGILLGLICLLHKRDILAGIAFSLTVLRPHWAIALGIPLMLTRRRVFLWFCLASGVLTFYSFVLVGSEGFRQIVSNTLMTSKGADVTTQQAKMYNLVGLFTRFGLSPFWAWPFYGGSVAAIILLWRKEGITRETFGLAMILMLFFSPHLHTHDLALLIIPLLVWPAILSPVLSLVIIASLVLSFQQIAVIGIMAAISYQLVGKLKPYLLFR